MAFIKTPNVYDPATFDAIESGELKLQPGQWIRCGADNDHAAMWIGRNPQSGVMYAAHWQGSRARTLARYHDLKAAVSDRIKSA